MSVLTHRLLFCCNSIIDPTETTSIGFQWSKGEQGRRAIEEIDQLGERETIQPKL